MNKTGNNVAEFMEERILTKGNNQQCARIQTQSWENTMSRLLIVRKVARKDKKQQFTNLFHHINEALLRNSFLKLKRKSAPGCDGVTWQQYVTTLDENIHSLHQRLNKGSYKPKPARRVFIPKEDGSMRPLSIICLEDKIVQQATVEVLNKIYETDFLGFSYGFRPNRGQHDALDALTVAIIKRRVNWVLDLDISKFFDMVEHDWLLQFIQHRIQDKRVIRLLTQWLKVGVLDERGHRVKSLRGTPQGAVISPLLANIYLHYSFDLWLNQQRNRAMGDITIVRYADDAVLGFQNHSDAVNCLTGLTERMSKFGLKVHPDKTKLVRFGLFARQQYVERSSRGKPGTFDFLGFTFYVGKTRSGKPVIKRKTKRKRLTAQIKFIRAELRKRLHEKPYDTGRWLRKVVQGHINYYGVPFNARSLNLFVNEVTKAWLWSLRRRSQRHNMNWKRFKFYAQHFIPSPKIVHPYPEMRFYAKHPR